MVVIDDDHEILNALIESKVTIEIDRLHHDLNCIKFTTTFILSLMLTYIISGLYLEVISNRYV